MNKIVDTSIREVTVYDNQALVTRRGIVQLTGEEHELIIAQLPVTIVSESIRASGTGTMAVRLLGVRTERTYITEAIADQVALLHQEIEQLEVQKRTVQDQLVLLNHQQHFIKSLNTQYLERLTRFPNPELMNLVQIRELLSFVEQQYGEYANAIAQCEKQQQQLDKQIQILRQNLQQISTPSPQEIFNIIVSLEPSEAGEFELEVSYIVHQASWLPLYDLRFSTENETIDITYLAEVQQSTGEDWLDVALTLSTAKPGLGTLPPKIIPWYVDVQRFIYPGQLAKALADSDITKLRNLSASMPFPGMSPEPTATEVEIEYLKAQTATAEIFKQGSVITFGVSGKGNIPSDGTPHKTTVFNENYPCRTKYIAIPRLVSMAYLQATVTNSLTGVTMLPGAANIFRDNTFVGKTDLENIAPGQEFKLNLGIDEGLKIQRDLVERHVDKKLIGNQRCTTYGYRLMITNLRDRVAELTLIEQLPVSRSEQIKIRLTRSNPQVQMGEMGLLEWSLTLPPQSSQDLYYQFTIEHPPDLNVFGLDI